MRIAITTMDGMTLVRKKSLPPFRKQAHMHATALSPDQTDKRKPSAVCHIMFAAALPKCHVLLWAVGLELYAPHELRIVSFFDKSRKHELFISHKPAITVSDISPVQKYQQNAQRQRREEMSTKIVEHHSSKQRVPPTETQSCRVQKISASQKAVICSGQNVLGFNSCKRIK